MGAEVEIEEYRERKWRETERGEAIPRGGMVDGGRQRNRDPAGDDQSVKHLSITFNNGWVVTSNY